MNKRIRFILLTIAGALALAALLYALPPIRNRVDYQVDDWKTKIKYGLDPPEKVVFVPQNASVGVGLGSAAAKRTMQAVVEATLAALPTSTALVSDPGTGAGQPELTSSPNAEGAALSGGAGEVTTIPASPTPTPSLTPTPLPGSISLKGVRYEDQHGLWNYCGPANLSMALSFWGWDGDRLDTGKYLKPYDKDKNVMPYEMVDFVNTQTDGLKAVERVGGSLQLLKTLLANGYPVLVEKGAYLRDTTGVRSWMGHYEVVTGYDEAKQVFIAQDSYLKPDLEVPYAEFESGWRAFNFTYILIFTPEEESRISAILGPDWDEAANLRQAYELASTESISLSGIDGLFALFNRGTNMVALQDYMGAAEAYNQYFQEYASLDIPDNERPWRMLWYQTGPYKAYYYAGSYFTVIDLATITLERMVNEPTLEESYYWRGMAKAAAGDTAGAIEDFRQALKWHPSWYLALQQLALLGAEP